MNNDKVIELAKKCNADLTTFDGEPLSYTFAIANLEKFVELLQSQSEPVLQIAIDYSHWIDVDAETYSDINNSIEKRILFTHPPLSVSEQDKSDAEKYRAINTPEIQDFIKAIELEALHQRHRWGAEGDAGKTDADWFWLIGYLAGKTINNPEKALHHIITTAAACLNWHGAKIGNYTYMRPGTDQAIANKKAGE